MPYNVLEPDIVLNQVTGGTTGWKGIPSSFGSHVHVNECGILADRGGGGGGGGGGEALFA